MDTPTKWALGLVGGAVVVGGGLYFLMKPAAAAAPASAAPLPPLTPSTPHPIVTLAPGNLGTISLPSFSAASAQSGESISLQGPTYLTSPPTQGVVSANVASSNQAVISITQLMQQQSSSTLSTYPINGPGTTVLSGTYLDNNGVTQTWQLTVTVAP
jgi:hypothetical protein